MHYGRPANLHSSAYTVRIAEAGRSACSLLYALIHLYIPLYPYTLYTLILLYPYIYPYTLITLYTLKPLYRVNVLSCNPRSRER